MTQFSSGVLALQTAATKNNYWELALEDSLDCVARSPQVAAMIYRRLTTGKTDLAAGLDKNLDWGANFTNQLGFTDKKFWDCMRLYLTIHVDHDGGNVSANMMDVGSALSEPYLSFSAHLHGLTNQEVLTYLLEIAQEVQGGRR